MKQVVQLTKQQSSCCVGSMSCHSLWMFCVCIARGRAGVSRWNMSTTIHSLYPSPGLSLSRFLSCPARLFLNRLIIVSLRTPSSPSSPSFTTRGWKIEARSCRAPAAQSPSFLRNESTPFTSPLPPASNIGADRRRWNPRLPRGRRRSRSMASNHDGKYSDRRCSSALESIRLMVN